MQTQIMVPLDGSLFSEQALAYALELASRISAQLHLVKVHVGTPQRVRQSAALGLLWDFNELVTDDREYLSRLAEATRWRAALDPVTASLDGDVVPALERYVSSARVDLIVMTTHGRGGVERARLGSVADALGHRVSVPLLLLRPRAGAAVIDATTPLLERVLIPVDGSQLSECAIRHTLRLFGSARIRYTLMQVVTPPQAVALSDSVPVPLPVSYDTEDQLRSNARDYLEQLAQPHRARGYRIDTAVIVRPRAVVGILHLAYRTRADLIAMATHGRSGFKRLVLGSVADAVVRGSDTPLLLMRAAAKPRHGHKENAS